MTLQIGIFINVIIKIGIAGSSKQECLEKVSRGSQKVPHRERTDIENCEKVPRSND